MCDDVHVWYVYVMCMMCVCDVYDECVMCVYVCSSGQ